MKRATLLGCGLVWALTSALSGATIDKSRFLSPKFASFFRATAASTSTYIGFSVDDDGQFTIGTVLGDPARAEDDDKKLIYGHPSPGTSDTYLRVDGISYSLHSGVSSNVTATATGLTVSITTAGINVVESLDVVTSQATGRPDAVRVRFQITNADSVAHNVSLRTQLDTQLGDNDGAPFRIPNVGSVTHDREFLVGSSTSPIPSQTLVLDDLVSPDVIALMTFLLTNTGLANFETPHRVVLGYWPDAVGSYDYTVDPTNNFLDNNNDGTITGSSPDSDSAVVIYWGYPDASAFVLAAGDSKNVAFDYGIGNCTAGGGDPFNILFCAPAQIDGAVSGQSYQYTPVTISAFLTNASAATVSGGLATLNLTPDFKLVSGYQAARPIESSAGSGQVAANASAQIDWQLTSNGRYLGPRQLSLSVDANGRHAGVLRAILTTTIPNLLYGMATDQDGNPIAGATITVFLGSSIVGTATTQSDGTYSVSGLAPGEYTVRLSVTGRPDSYFQAYVSATSDSGRTGNPSSFSSASSLTTYVYPNPVREGRAHITFFTDSAQAADVQIFTTAGQLIQTLSLGTPGSGWHVIDWPIDNVANGVYFYQIKVGSSRAHGKIAVLKRRGL